ncbi:ABC transporter [Leucobacter chromiireducens]|uniref:ABC transporter n=1 Tax=Leucobacter chromiireducens TaxID=283877 RepID=UPI000F63C4A8|nr:ABC transporter [Leucobacter chromiireducens]
MTRITTPHARTALAVGSLALGALTLLGCAAPAEHAAHAGQAAHAATDGGDSAASTPSTESGHGAVAGAAEVAEPQLHLVTLDSSGAVGLLDLLSGTESRLGTVASPDRVASDGRYVFAANSSGIEVIDSAAWTWDHGDHFHYYRGTPRILGEVTGSGIAQVVGGPLATAGGTGVFFPDSGEAVLLDNAALADGSPDERFRVRGTPHAGFLAPLGDGAIVTEADASGRVTRLRVLAADGSPSEITAPCRDASGAVTTRVGAVFTCADGAVLGTLDAGSDADSPAAVTLERIPLPAAAPGTGQAAPTTLAGRKGRPTVAGVGADQGFWRLDTRDRSWRWTPSDAPLVHAVAVDDEADHVVTLDTAGRVRVYAGDREIGASEPLLSAAELAADARDALTLTVDAQRAYLASPSSGTVFEIDFADRARIARELHPAVAPAFFAETGR